MLDAELTPGVHLRRPVEADLDELVAVIEANTAHLAPWMPWMRGFTRERELEFIRASERDALIVRDGRIAGSCGLHHVEREHGVTALGYWLAADAQGAGIATAAVRALLAHAFADLGLNRVEIFAAVDNTRSRAVAERCGFTLEGVLREAQRIGDRRLDHALYSLLRAEWEGVRPPV